ncbi:hypothetical protein J2786_004393 [Chryseobacterium vietnamense]|uniref:Uncharacterized protein n=1 Tax=Chryseobacterium vietnamense TaxID=866785 RepID=A0ACC6JDV1_9FLAO|nr:hypothetical protein [Chryseobacterium vietnamense]
MIDATNDFNMVKNKILRVNDGNSSKAVSISIFMLSRVEAFQLS